MVLKGSRMSDSISDDHLEPDDGGVGGPPAVRSTRQSHLQNHMN